MDERPDLKVTASEVSPEAVDLARENAELLGLPLEIEVADGVPPGEYDLVIANLPYVRDDRWDELMPEINRYEPREALTGGEDGLDMIRELVAAVPSGTQLALEHAEDQADAVRGTAGGGRHLPRPRGLRRASPSAARRDAGGRRDLRAVHLGRRRGALPRRHGLRAGHRARLARGSRPPLRGSRAAPPDKPAAVMFFQLDAALAGLPELGERTRAAVERLLPGGVTLLLPNPERRYPLACGPEARARSGSGCRCSRASWPRSRRSAGRCSSRARTARASPTRAGIDGRGRERPRGRGSRPRRRRAARHAVHRARPLRRTRRTASGR